MHTKCSSRHGCNSSTNVQSSGVIYKSTSSGEALSITERTCLCLIFWPWAEGREAMTTLKPEGISCLDRGNVSAFFPYSVQAGALRSPKGENKGHFVLPIKQCVQLQRKRKLLFYTDKASNKNNI